MRYSLSRLGMVSVWFWNEGVLVRKIRVELEAGSLGVDVVETGRGPAIRRCIDTPAASLT